MRTATEVVMDLDILMKHYIDWAVSSDGASHTEYTKMAKACERARNIMAEAFGEPAKEDWDDYQTTRKQAY